jgi:hypothetical protein
MKEQFDAILTGSDSPIDGIATLIDLDGYRLMNLNPLMAHSTW